LTGLEEKPLIQVLFFLSGTNALRIRDRTWNATDFEVSENGSGTYLVAHDKYPTEEHHCGGHGTGYIDPIFSREVGNE
jgi:hypothetical protein